ncbi:exopolyphosphatase [Limosilactobacillus frumenti]|uniref:exopolyphosphatase n=1 Tax=Limosilactobacillus frumenti TaxID=104955 RepID=UPI0015EC5455|nr:exopolyphosphatase [Limosilactobacillus frumenti]MBA2913755.1 exopolyphosphatase [Limosilactobacillus frumenti]
MKNDMIAVIYLQPDQVRMRIVERPDFKIINNVQSGSFQIDTNGPTANYMANMEAIVDNIEGFKELARDYQVKNILFYGAREDLDEVTASYVRDQLEVRTGLTIEWLNNNQLMAELMSHIMTTLPDFKKMSKHCLYLLSIGLDSTTLAFFQHDQFEASWEIDLGGAHIHQLVERLNQTTTNPNEIIQDYINSKLEYLEPELKRHKKTVLLIQNSATLNARYIPKHEHLAKLPRDQFQDTLKHMLLTSDNYLQRYLGVNQQFPYALPNYLVIARMARIIAPQSIYVTDLSTMGGLSTGIAVDNTDDQQKRDNMIRTSADNMARRYGVDPSHSDFVTRFALQLFDQLKPIHRLNNHYRLLLEIAAKIDDIGNFINQEGHYRHSAYILEANPLIGLSDQDNRIIAEVARYHSAEVPTVSQSHYRHLDDDLQLPVAKLAAILRLVDALDDSRQQKISQLRLKLKGQRLVIKATANDDLVLEKWSFSKKSQLFTDVFGITPVLKEKEGR